MRILFFIATIAILGFLAYYFFFRPFEFEGRFNARTTPGDIIQSLRIWTKSMEEARIVEVDSFNRVIQIVSLEGRTYDYDWRFYSENDSVTKVKVRISQPDRRFFNKLLVPFTEQDIEKDAAVLVREFYDVLSTHLEITQVKLKGEFLIDSAFCICANLHSDQIEKANGMMMAYSPLTSFVSNSQLQVSGRPMVRINSWSHSKGAITFDFCFPVKRKKELPQSQIFFYKNFPQQKVLKAEFFGNYITSDRGWYALIRYASENNYEVTGLPIEVFHNNPTLGMNEKDWKADILLPVQ